jgi:hypothetical protein
VHVLAALAPSLDDAMQTAAAKAYVILGGTLLRIDRVARASQRDRAYGVTAVADPPTMARHRRPRPHRRSRHDRTTRKFVRRELSAGQKAANHAHSALRAPGERANAELKNWAHPPPTPPARRRHPDPGHQG